MLPCIAKRLMVLLLLTGASGAWGKAPRVKHDPQQPKSAQPVQVTVELTGSAIQEACLLEYQIVDPGKYIALQDPDFQSRWTTMKMQEVAGGALGAAGNRLVSAQLPPDLQKHRRLVRYRIRSAGSNKIIAPDTDDAQPNFAYFVYDGVPAWKAAVNPKNG